MNCHIKTNKIKNLTAADGRKHEEDKYEFIYFYIFDRILIFWV